ncbi:unnamed protein product [Spirodela intermedia]|uniref:Germin-like protein n=1 Tax=Spirodela intermedia TaxID=51605 RepID=A0A7I8JFY4_SPIIN|nr:unnamed protein product [Spirodela intermedia]CAA6668851.1 unnamed protein product [Spirodela intermedia]
MRASSLAAALFAFLALVGSTSASDPDLLQDVCVADLNSTVKVNGFPCKAQFNATDFFSNLYRIDYPRRSKPPAHASPPRRGIHHHRHVLVAKTIKPGEVFVFPRGLVHFQRNNGNVPAAVVAAFNSQLPGTQTIANTLFGATPPVGIQEVQFVKSKFAPK